MWWTAIIVLAIMTIVEMKKLESVTNSTSECAADRARTRTHAITRNNVSTNENMLCDPLIAQAVHIEEERGKHVEQNPGDVRGLNDISGDAKYEASFKDLFKLCLPDLHLLVIAFIFLIGAAISQIYIPKFTGDLLDALTKATPENNNTKPSDDIWKVPGFMSNILKLVIAALISGIFAAFRGSIITLVSAYAIHMLISNV